MTTVNFPGRYLVRVGSPDQRRQFVAQPDISPSLLFFVGLLAPFYVQIGGQLYVTEILALVLLGPLLLIRRSPAFSTLLFQIIIFSCAVGCVSLFLSTLWNRTYLPTTFSAVSSLVVFAVAVAALLLCASSYRSYKFLFSGIALGSLIATVIQPVPEFHEAPWKFGYGFPVTVLCLVGLDKIDSRALRVVGIGVLAALHVVNDFRSMALFLIVVALFQTRSTNRLTFEGSALSRRRSRRGTTRVLVLVGAVVGAGIVLSQIYAYLIERGVLGESAAVRLRLQGGGSPVLMFLGGRNEIFFSLPAILHEPWIGYGPGNTAPGDIVNKGREALADFGLPLISAQAPTSGSIPTHSFLTGAWVDSGVAGALTWLIVLALLLVTLLIHIREDVVPPFGSYMLILGVWNTLFSPFGGSTRFVTAAIIAMVLASRLERSGHGSFGTSRKETRVWPILQRV